VEDGASTDEAGEGAVWSGANVAMDNATFLFNAHSAGGAVFVIDIDKKPGFMRISNSRCMLATHCNDASHLVQVGQPWCTCPTMVVCLSSNRVSCVFGLTALPVHMLASVNVRVYVIMQV
jgi:hypothetical protein